MHHNSKHYKCNLEIFSISADQEMIIPKWLFELPIIEPERNEFRNSKNYRAINCDSQYEIVFFTTNNLRFHIESDIYFKFLNSTLRKMNFSFVEFVSSQ